MQIDNIWWWVLHTICLLLALYSNYSIKYPKGSMKDNWGSIAGCINIIPLALTIYFFGWINLFIIIIEWIIIFFATGFAFKMRRNERQENININLIQNEKYKARKKLDLNDIHNSIPLLKIVAAQNKIMETIVGNASKMFTESRNVLNSVDYAAYLEMFLNFKSDYWINFELIKHYKIGDKSELGIAIKDYKGNVLKFFTKYAESLDLLIELLNVGVDRIKGKISNSEFAKKFWALSHERDLVIKELHKLNFDESLKKVENLYIAKQDINLEEITENDKVELTQNENLLQRQGFKKDFGIDLKRQGLAVGETVLIRNSFIPRNLILFPDGNSSITADIFDKCVSFDFDYKIVGSFISLFAEFGLIDVEDLDAKMKIRTQTPIIINFNKLLEIRGMCLNCVLGESDKTLLDSEEFIPLVIKSIKIEKQPVATLLD